MRDLGKILAFPGPDAEVVPSDLESERTCPPCATSLAAVTHVTSKNRSFIETKRAVGWKAYAIKRRHPKLILTKA